MAAALGPNSARDPLKLYSFCSASYSLPKFYPVDTFTSENLDTKSGLLWTQFLDSNFISHLPLLHIHPFHHRPHSPTNLDRILRQIFIQIHQQKEQNLSYHPIRGLVVEESRRIRPYLLITSGRRFDQSREDQDICAFEGGTGTWRARLG